MGFFSKIILSMFGQIESKSYAQKKEWYLTDAAKKEWEEDVRLHFDEMIDCWNDDNNRYQEVYDVVGFQVDKRNKAQLKKYENWPAMFIKRFLIANKCGCSARSAYLATMIADCADGAGNGIISLSYPDIINPEKNPLLKVAMKIEKETIQDDGGYLYIISNNFIFSYIVKAYKKDKNVINEKWLYDIETYKLQSDDYRNDTRGKLISFLERTREKVKYPEYFYALSNAEKDYNNEENIKERQEKRRQEGERWLQEKREREEAEKAKKEAEKEAEQEKRAAAARIRCAKCESYGYCVSGSKNTNPYCPSYRDRK